MLWLCLCSSLFKPHQLPPGFGNTAIYCDVISQVCEALKGICYNYTSVLVKLVFCAIFFAGALQEVSSQEGHVWC